jgi:fucose permease
MGENKAIVCIFALIIVAFFLFGGNPDMTDALISQLMNTCSVEEVPHP